jgi:hypothetical protein
LSKTLLLVSDATAQNKQTGKMTTSGFKATGLYPLNRDTFEDLDLDAAT